MTATLTLVPTAVVPTLTPLPPTVTPSLTPLIPTATVRPTFTPLGRANLAQAATVQSPVETPERTAVPKPTPLTISPEAYELLLMAEANLSLLNSLTHERFITIQSPIFKLTEEVQCAMRPPDEIYCNIFRDSGYTGNAPTIADFEFIQQGQQVWIRQNDETVWTESPPDTTNYLQAQLDQLQPSSFVIGAELDAETVIDGAPVQAIRLVLDPITAVQTLYDDQALNNFLAQTKEAEATATLWIGQEDGYLRKLLVQITFTSPAGLVVIIGQGALNNFNEPVDIPVPR